jgi:hypothetical protein
MTRVTKVAVRFDSECELLILRDRKTVPMNCLLRSLPVPEPIDLLLTGKIRVFILDISGLEAPVTTLSLDCVRHLAGNQILATLFGLILPLEEPLINLVTKYGSSFKHVRNAKAITVVYSDGRRQVINFDNDALVEYFRRALSKELGLFPGDIVLKQNDVMLDDMQTVSQISDKVRCIPRLKKPPNYEAILVNLMDCSRRDRRTVVRCLTFHRYHFEEALSDLMGA